LKKPSSGNLSYSPARIFWYYYHVDSEKKCRQTDGRTDKLAL
jgi:hypothetical protein